MISTILENGYFAMKVEIKEKELELLKELDLAIKQKEGMKKMHSSVELICEGRQQAYLKVYERIFGVLCKNKDGSLDVLNLQSKISSVLKELKELLKS